FGGGALETRNIEASGAGRVGRVSGAAGQAVQRAEDNDYRDGWIVVCRARHAAAVDLDHSADYGSGSPDSADRVCECGVAVIVAGFGTTTGNRDPALDGCGVVAIAANDAHRERTAFSDIWWNRALARLCAAGDPAANDDKRGITGVLANAGQGGVRI